jgi:hypothetical protein
MKKIAANVLTVISFCLISCSNGVTEAQRDADFQKEFQKTRPRATTGETLENYIENYLAQKFLTPKKGGKIFCTREGFGSNHNGKAEQQEFDAYMWVVCQEYSKKGNTLKILSEHKGPISLRMLEKDRRYEALGFRVPRNGSFYQEDVAKMFPKFVRDNKMLSPGSEYHKRLSKELNMRIEQKAISSWKLN